MEIKGAWLAELCGTQRQNVYVLAKSGKLTKSDSGKFNIHEPLNKSFLMKHDKSCLDAENFIKEKENLSHCRTTTPKNQGKQQIINDQSDILFKVVNIVITRKYSPDEAREIKNLIFQEMGKHV